MYPQNPCVQMYHHIGIMAPVGINKGKMCGKNVPHILQTRHTHVSRAMFLAACEIMRFICNQRAGQWD